jgi:haloacid dehalogenase-like hydrolase
LSGSFRLLAVDLDGTLVRRDSSIDPRDRDALRAIRAGGVKIVVATGRLYPGAKASIDELGLQGTQICSDGAHLVDHPSGDDVHVIGLSGHGEAVRATLLESGLSAFVTVGVRVILDDASQGLRRFVEHITPHIEQVSDVYRESVLWVDGTGPSAVVAIGARPQIASVEPRLRSLDIDVLRYDVPGPAEMSSLTMRPHGASKGAALEYVAAEHGVAMGETVAVGDWLNDISMFQRAGRSFAMGHAPPSVKSAASEALQSRGGEGGGIAELVAKVWPDLL